MATAGDGRGRGPERAFVRPLPEFGRVCLDREESRHLLRARRVRAGEEVVLFDGLGRTRLGRVEETESGETVVEITGAYPDREPRGALTLAVALPEAGRADGMVSALAELGVSRLVPLTTSRTPPGRADLATRRRSRWERLAREAAKVNGRSRLLVVGEAVSLAALVDSGLRRLVLLDPDPALPRLAEVLPAEEPLPWLLVGPEGGFTREELEAAEREGAARARVGALALRIETAAVAAAAVALG